MKNTLKALAVIAIFAGGTAVVAAPVTNQIIFQGKDVSSFDFKGTNCKAQGKTRTVCDLKGGNAQVTIIPNRGKSKLTCVAVMTKGSVKLTGAACKGMVNGAPRGNLIILK
jgi:hypothetical protein